MFVLKNILKVKLGGRSRRGISRGASVILFVFLCFSIFLKEKKNTGDWMISLERGQSETPSSSDLESVFLFVLSFLVSTIFLKTKNPGEGMRR